MSADAVCDAGIQTWPQVAAFVAVLVVAVIFMAGLLIFALAVIGVWGGEDE